MTFERIAEILNELLKQEQPLKITGTWIFKFAPQTYRYIQKNIRTETDEIDWDRVTSKLDREFQKRWVRYRRKVVKPYRNKKEVGLVLRKYKNKLYTFITALDESDFTSMDIILIALVRLSQNGNLSAQKELIGLLRYVVDDWVERFYYLRKWKGYTDDLEDRIKGCIRCYKYTGSFLGYLYKTLEYAGRGIVSIQKFSLDDTVLDGAKRRMDFIGYDLNKNEMKVF